MEGFQHLLFEISSSERLTILNELQKNPLKLTQISKKLDIKVAEASRHLQRLSDDKLIQKENNGTYKLTSFGILTLKLLSGLRFASQHRDFFLEYNITKLPCEFIYRIGELNKGKYAPETLDNLAEGEKRIRQAQKFTYILSSQVLASSVPILAEKTKHPFDLKIILPQGKFPPEDKSKLPAKMQTIQKRVLPEVDFITVITENYAIFCPPNSNGKLDYTGFKGEDQSFIKWCKDLFLEYWNQAKPIGLSTT